MQINKAENRAEDGAKNNTENGAGKDVGRLRYPVLLDEARKPVENLL